jgi:hypothetical protein
MVLIYQPPNAHVRISWILLRNAMAAAAVKKIYSNQPITNSLEMKSHQWIPCFTHDFLGSHE